jgi:hypothetical protein
MKTQPANLLLALMLGFTGMVFVSTSVMAGSSDESKKEKEEKEKEKEDKEKEDKDKKDKDEKDAKDAKDAKDSKDSKDVSDSASCSSKLIAACGLNVIQTTCSSYPSYSIKSTEVDDGKHKSKDKDSKFKNDRDYNDDSHKDHVNRSNDSVGNKVAICHRMGGARVNLVVANDGWLSGHSKHALDTIGRCEDFDEAKNDSSKKDSDKKISASDAGYDRGLTPSQINCLSNLPGNITIPSSNQGSSRGGVRTLR